MDNREWAEAHLGQDIDIDGERVELARVLTTAPVVVLKAVGGPARLASFERVRRIWTGQNLRLGEA